jgi:hypothetical protein
LNPREKSRSLITPRGCNCKEEEEEDDTHSGIPPSVLLGPPDAPPVLATAGATVATTTSSSVRSIHPLPLSTIERKMSVTDSSVITVIQGIEH